MIKILSKERDGVDASSSKYAYFFYSNILKPVLFATIPKYFYNPALRIKVIRIGNGDFNSKNLFKKLASTLLFMPDLTQATAVSWAVPGLRAQCKTWLFPGHNTRK